MGKTAMARATQPQNKQKDYKRVSIEISFDTYPEDVLESIDDIENFFSFPGRKDFSTAIRSSVGRDPFEF